MTFPVTLKAADAKRIPTHFSGHVTAMCWPPGWDACVPSPPAWEMDCTEIKRQLNEAACLTVTVTALGYWESLVSSTPPALLLIYLVLNAYLGHVHEQRAFW